MRQALPIVCYKWRRPDGSALFRAAHVNALRAGLARHLQLPHRLFCVTDDPAGLDGDITAVPLPDTYAATPRCRRRMQQWSREFDAQIGAQRKLAIDLDVVLVGDITPIVNRPEPIVGWRVGHAGVYSGSFLLADAGALHGAWELFAADPDGYPQIACENLGVGSDQAMLNHWLQKTQRRIATWTERDGFVSFYGDGYRRFEKLGVGPTFRQLPPGARIVVLGSDDLPVLSDPSYSWVREHYLPLMPATAGAAS